MVVLSAAVAALVAVAPSPARDDAEVPPDKAFVLVRLPADAVLTIDAAATVQTGPERLFVTPALEAGKSYRYTLKAAWKVNGQPHVESQEVVVQAGKQSVAEFGPKGADKPAGEVAAKAASQKGMLLYRPVGDEKWSVADEHAALAAEDLVIGIPGAVLESNDGAVRLRLVRHAESPLPVIEPGVVLHKPGDASLDFSLDRGMVELTNLAKGASRVRVHVRDRVWDLNLQDPGGQVLLEFYSTWPKGSHFHKKLDPKDVPLAQLTFVMLKGDMDLTHAGRAVLLGAPPGPASIAWDSVTGMDKSPQHLAELPAWILPPTDDAGKERAKMREAVLKRLREAVAAKPLGEVLDEFVESENAIDRRAAVIIMTATDDLTRLAKAIRETKYPDVWQESVLSLRHWIGRAPGQDQKLYQRAVDKKFFTPEEAAAVLQLLHSFGDADLAKPILYEKLIDYLDDDQMYLRGLAYWHLSRLVPEGKKFHYDPRAPKEERDKAVEEWKKLIPPGKLPPALKEEPAAPKEESK
jgi:uncharacterized protein (TIGR03000 family)